MPDPTPLPQPPLTMRVQPFARWNPTRGIWETMQPDLSGRLAPWRETWPTCGAMHDGSAYRHPPSALPISGSVPSSSPTTLFRTPLASDSSRGGESLEQVRARRGTIALSHQVIDLALHGPHGSPKQSSEVETLWSLIEDIFTAGDATPQPSPNGNTSLDAPAPAPAFLNEAKGPRPAPGFVEWLMGLERGWVTEPAHGLTDNQQLTALGNGVLPLQATQALGVMMSMPY